MSIFFRILVPLLKPRGKEAFLKSLREGAKVLDVGCGNNSPSRAKRCAPRVWYVGLDVCDYNQRPDSIRSADEYIIAAPCDFAMTIERASNAFDAVISSHNLEHCDEPDRVLGAICLALRPGGRLYLSFPAEASVGFPSRKNNTLNFFDDPTHTIPPQCERVLSIMRKNGLILEFVSKRYRPIVPLIVGLMVEPFSAMAGRAMPFGVTWALYGFETVIWATRR